MNHALCLFVFLSLLCVSLGFAAEPVFYARDGSASYPDATIPYDFDGASGKHIKWKAPLPNWSNSDPIVDAGKVFVLSEPVKGYAPFLLCFDAASGKELWRRELDPVTCLPAGEQQAVRTFVQETWDWWRHQESLWSEAHLLREEHKAAFTGEEPPAAIAARWKAIKQEVEAAGCVFAFKSGAGGPSAPFRLADKNSEQAQRLARLKDLSLSLAAWRGSGTWLGVAFPAPVSYDGRVYTVTQHNHFACHGHDGKLIWQRQFPKTDSRLLTSATSDRVPKNWRVPWPGLGGFATSPIMADGLLLCNAGQMLRALDAKTGQPRWELPYRWEIGQWHCSPSVARVDGEAVMIAAGNGGSKDFKGDELIRIRDGASVGLVPSRSGARSRSVTIVVDGDLVVTTVGLGKRQSATVGYRLSWNADRSALVCTEVWRLPDPRGFTALKRQPWIDGTVHHPAGVLDLRTGTMVRAPGYERYELKGNGGYCGQGGFIAGKAYCKWNFYKGQFLFFDRSSGQPLGIGTLPVNPPDGLPAAQKQAEEHRRKDWRWLGAGTPFAVGNRLYVRSYDFLWCIDQ